MSFNLRFRNTFQMSVSRKTIRHYKKIKKAKNTRTWQDTTMAMAAWRNCQDIALEPVSKTTHCRSGQPCIFRKQVVLLIEMFLPHYHCKISVLFTCKLELDSTILVFCIIKPVVVQYIKNNICIPSTTRSFISLVNTYNMVRSLLAILRH